MQVHKRKFMHAYTLIASYRWSLRWGKSRAWLAWNGISSILKTKTCAPACSVTSVPAPALDPLGFISIWSKCHDLPLWKMWLGLVDRFCLWIYTAAACSNVSCSRKRLDKSWSTRVKRHKERLKMWLLVCSWLELCNCQWGCQIYWGVSRLCSSNRKFRNQVRLFIINIILKWICLRVLSA